ncbi:MAG: hypothetical protein ACKVKG_00075 [Alphaproteobacteria bacterium]|jgi:hypothetical protein
MFTNDSTLVQIISVAFTKTALFTVFAVALILSLFSRAVGRVRHA